jgi:dipeptidyl aminopeptidase/acylaminoacyl peptidase
MTAESLEASGDESAQISEAQIAVHSRVGMQPKDIGGLRQVEDPRVSPDGSMVTFVVADVDLEANRYRRRVWVAAADGRELARPFTAGPRDRMPRWSPDGRLLAFVAGAEDGSSEICVLPFAYGGERVGIAAWPAAVSELTWSPDGVSLAFVGRDPDPDRYGPPGEERKPKDMPPRRITRLFSRLDTEGWVFDRPSRVMVVNADGSSPPRSLTTGPFQANGVAWSPDGARVAFASARHETWDLDLAVDLWVVASDGLGLPERLTETAAAYSHPSWSPDGTQIAYLRSSSDLDEPRHQQMGVVDLATGERRELTTGLDRNCGPYGAARPPVWAGDRLLFGVEDAGNVHVYSVPVTGDGKPEAVADGERWVSSWDWAGGTLAIAVSTPTTFPELVVRRRALPDSEPPLPERRLTDLTGPFASQVELVEPEPFVARSADGTEVPCWAMAPVGLEGGRRYPTLLNIHGGPFTSYGNRFSDEFQLEVGHGFGVIYCNPRGSSGYTESWGRAVRWPECDVDPGSGWGGVDFDDVMACVQEACSRYDWVDPDCLGVMGGSYGGFMTSWAIGHSDRFKAACSERACNNLLSLEQSSDIATAFRGYVGRTHLEDPQAYLRQSPISYVTAMTTPVLIVHSEDDLRCPINQGEELFVALRLLGREPEMVRFPGESHELTRAGAPGHRVSRVELILDWFDDRLSS